jgi:hypothetical protein
MTRTAKEDLLRRYLESADSVIGPVLAEPIDDTVGIIDLTEMGVEFPFLVELHAFGADAYLDQGDTEMTDVPATAYTLQAGERRVVMVADAAHAFIAVKLRGEAGVGAELIASACKDEEEA